jgi:HD-GYP domain-containing protein (c-di-GMP phosphodiesterase class II)
MEIGKAIGFDSEQLSVLNLVGLVHDIGKIGINENILNKAGPLTEAEYEEMKRHPQIGYRILSSTNEMSDLAFYTLCHHERWDGKGYPKGIKGVEIPMVSRIIAVADAYDAMTSERPYREPQSVQSAVSELQKFSGTQFDPDVVDVFVEKVLKDYL